MAAAVTRRPRIPGTTALPVERICAIEIADVYDDHDARVLWERIREAA